MVPGSGVNGLDDDERAVLLEYCALLEKFTNEGGGMAIFGGGLNECLFELLSSESVEEKPFNNEIQFNSSTAVLTRQASERFATLTLQDVKDSGGCSSYLKSSGGTGGIGALDPIVQTSDFIPCIYSGRTIKNRQMLKFRVEVLHLGSQLIQMIPRV
eukprot:TRINITY_DN7083_c0_g1_i2.p1 TRINITY_DN7083_c0_g1~~TRINITY_DN7083_c0_g1_i2.p1  ORF type:complete len:157 (+),score=16.81 TRINITY_DN7083_c0_g1_i2:630-1100(+)